MVVAVAKALEDGARMVLCASTGNTAASAAAYAARAGMSCTVILPAGQVAAGKLAQAIAHGAHVVGVRGPFDAALEVVRQLAEQGEATLVNSVNPHRLEGQKTAAFEICEALGDAPEALFIPVGNAGNITAYWKGFVEAARTGLARGRPRMYGYQAEGAAPLVSGKPVAQPETVATAIRVGNPASWKGAVAARDESGGAIDAVSDDEILEAYSFLARCEGVFAEPASAAAIAGLRKRVRANALGGAKRVVCVLTGNGMKDPDRARSLAGDIPVTSLIEIAGRARCLKRERTVQHSLHLLPSLGVHVSTLRAISRCSQARAEVHSRETVAGEIPITSEVSAIDRPPKKRSSTI